MDKATPIVTAEEILARLRTGVKDSYEIKMRGAVIPVRVLSISEANMIRSRARKTAVLNQGDETDVNLQIQKETLSLASCVPTGSAPILSEKVLAMLTTDEICFLFEEYIGVMERVNPSVEQILPEEFRALVDALKKKAVSVRDLSIHQRNAICTAFVELITRQENRNSPSGS